MSLNTLDLRTMAAYERLMEEYAELVMATIDMRRALKAVFLDRLSPGDAKVLDWGCGQGEMAALMMGRGIDVEATDASPAMARAAASLGVEVRIEPFEALARDPPRYRGIWAHVSLCHARREDVPRLVELGAETLLPDGIFHICMKQGKGEGRDSLDRFFSYWNPEELVAIFEGSGMEVIAQDVSGRTGLRGLNEFFCTIVGRKPCG